MHDVRAGADPVGADPPAHARRQPRHGDRSAPRHQPGELRRIGPEQRLPYARVHAVGADQHVAARRAAIEPQRDPVRRLLEARALRIQMDRVRLLAPHAVGEHREEIGAVDRVVREAVPFDRDRTEIEQLPRLAGVPEAHFLAGGFAGERAQRIAHAELVQDAVAVSADLQARADFAQLARLLVHVDVEAALQ